MTETKDHFSIGEVAQATGLTHRALRYYDAIGLVQPSLRQANGYRCYRRNDLLRLHEVCLYRDLGLSLNEIAEIIANDGQRTLRLSEQLLTTRMKLGNAGARAMPGPKVSGEQRAIQSKTGRTSRRSGGRFTPAFLPYSKLALRLKARQFKSRLKPIDYSSIGASTLVR